MGGGSWADHTLKLLGYDSSPSKLQLIIRKLFQRICRRGFTLPQQGHTEIEPFPLFQVLTDHSDYCQRVEPSVTGGRKMAAAFPMLFSPKIEDWKIAPRGTLLKQQGQLSDPGDSGSCWCLRSSL